MALKEERLFLKIQKFSDRRIRRRRSMKNLIDKSPQNSSRHFQVVPDLNDCAGGLCTPLEMQQIEDIRQERSGIPETLGVVCILKFDEKYLHKSRKLKTLDMSSQALRERQLELENLSLFIEGRISSRSEY